MKPMLSPFSEKMLTIQSRKEIITFRKEEFEVVHHFYEDMGQEFTTSETDDVTLQQVYNQYREKYKLPFPEQIQAIREKYQVSASKMSEVLGFGINVYRQYESGEVPNQSNARLIQLAKDPEEFRKLVLLSDAFNDKEQEKILKRVEGLIQEEKSHFSQLIINDYLLCNDTEPSSKNGYVLPNLEKIQNVIIYLVEHIVPWKTGLNKLLFYTDFAHYRNYGKSIMGLQYRAIPLGTVPSNYDRILANVVEKELVQVEYVQFNNGNVGENYKHNPLHPFDESLFSELELKTLQSVVERFKGKTTAQIVKQNHQEKAWIDNYEQRGLVDYGYAFGLSWI
jgi:DNA-binding transcriptional regulator YiaG